MLIAGFPAGPWATNCYLVATKPGAECVVIDPGKGAEAGIRSLVAEHRLKPVAVMVTHGHLDHVWCVVPVAGGYDATAYLHPADRHLLADPLAGISAGSASLLAGSDYTYAEPDAVVELADGDRLELAGVSFRVDHAPGHTAGSVTFSIAGVGDAPGLMFSGDLLFAGSIGRTDLPGGDPRAMRRSLREKVLPLADEIGVLPGHGEQTTIGRERSSNPHLMAMVRDDSMAGPGRGL